jgi:rubrerythrin
VLNDFVEGEITRRSDLLLALRTAIGSEERATRFYTEAALNFADRHAKIFFRILAESGRSRLSQLNALCVSIDREGLQFGTVEPLQLQATG